MAEPKFCYRHPASIAKRKCYRCAVPLCSHCQLKLDHHLFCSTQCHKSYLADQAMRVSTPYARYALYVCAILMTSGLVYFALLADAFYNGDNQGVQPKLSDLTPSLPVETDPSAEEIIIQRPLNGMKSPSQMVPVEGKAPPSAIVALYLNGSLMESTVARNGIYRFPQVLLTKHANVIQTRFYATNGTSNASSAIMVFHQESIKAQNENPGFFQNSSDNISRGNVHRKEIVLTFDGGSHANSCGTILTTLERFGIRSSVFLTGEFIEKYPDFTRRIAAKHEVGNHTYSHDHVTTNASNYQQNTTQHLTREELQTQLRKTEEVYFHVTGRRMAPLWRAPYGAQNLQIRKWAAELGYVHVAWTSNPRNRQNMDSMDWVPTSRHPGYFPAMLIKDRILSFGQNEPEEANGAIILMHLGTEREPHDRVDKWLPEMIKTFKQRKYRFVTASELLDRHDRFPEATRAAK